MTNFLSKDIWFKISLVVIFCGVVFTSFYRLSESPPTWTDEGLIIQTAQNLAGQGIYGFQIAPNTLISPSFISTSFPVTHPISLSFYLFGISLINARIVMAFYIIALIFTVFLLFKNKIREELIWTLLLIGSFPPLYGHGKNVLGEIPGLFFILVSALFLKNIESNKNNLISWSIFGLFFGLALATKPIFILALPGFVFVILKIYFSDRAIDLKKFGVLFLTSILPILIWLWVQFFSTDSWLSVIHYYSNPHSLPILEAIFVNLKDFFSNARTLFAGGVFLFWSITLIYSYYKNKNVSLFEKYLYIFSLFVFVLYFRNPPYYRYFLIPEVFSLIFLSFNLFVFSADKTWLKNTFRIILFLLFTFQLYQLIFNSWVADSYQSSRTRIMQETIGGVISVEKQVFFYQAPEAVIFLKHFNYYQYFSGTVSTEFGEENLKLIKDRKDLLVITRKDSFLIEKELFYKYYIIKEFDRYVLAGK